MKTYSVTGALACSRPGDAREQALGIAEWNAKRDLAAVRVQARGPKEAVRKATKVLREQGKAPRRKTKRCSCELALTATEVT